VKLSLGKDNLHEAPEEHFICPGETKPEELNLLILGGGTGGTIAAWNLCSARAARRSHRTQIHRRVVPEHRLLAKQKRHSQRKGCFVHAQKRRVRHRQKEMSGNDSHIQTKEK
jgi:hypothetical protein